MDLIDQLAEARIQEAMAQGELSNLPGEGLPLALDDDSMVPKELRMAYRILKNAGFLPPEMQARKDLLAAEQLLMEIEDSADYARAHARLQVLRLRISHSRREHPLQLRIDDTYYKDLLHRLARR